MSGRRRTAGHLQPKPQCGNTHAVMQFNRSPSSLALKGRALKVSRKVDGKSRPPLSCGADPGPSGFDWKEWQPTDDAN
jgi:hypothetical protein